ncbi:MAG: polyphenol oxidase family protein, partial [Alphaproteobacteria bacterium]
MQILRAPAWTDHSAIKHGFFARGGGVSSGIYASLNCGFGSNDATRDVAENRDRVAAALGIAQTNLLTVFQIHSAQVVNVTTPWVPGNAPKADAMVSDRPGIGLAILTADCAPILFADVSAGIVGAAHAGWRGALDGVVEATVAAMTDLGASRADIRATIGPCIAQPSYE